MNDERQAEQHRPSRKEKSHRDLDVYQRAMEAAMRVFEMSKAFPKEETYSLTDQIRRSSRSVCANLAEAWRSLLQLRADVSKTAKGEACSDCYYELLGIEQQVEFYKGFDYREIEGREPITSGRARSPEALHHAFAEYEISEVVALFSA